MIPNRDIYADANGNITDDPEQYARQVAVKGCFLDPRIVQQYGIADMLVSTTEPQAARRVTGRNASSVQITKATETEEITQEPQEPAEAVETDKPTAKKEKTK